MKRNSNNERFELEQLVNRIHQLTLQWCDGKNAHQANGATRKNRDDSNFDVVSTLNQFLNFLSGGVSSNLQHIGKEEASFILTNVVKALRHRFDETIFSKFCQVVVAVCSSKHQISINTNIIEDVVEILYKSKPSLPNTRMDQLRALSYAIFENGGRLNARYYIQPLILFLSPLANPNNSDKETQRLAITCLGNVCTKAGANMKDLYPHIFKLLRSNFEYYASEIHKDLSSAKLLSNSLRSLQYVILEGKILHEEDIKTILTSLKSVCFLGTAVNPLPNMTHSNNNNVSSNNKRRGNKVPHDDHDNGTISSDSEQSDSELHDRYQIWKVRLHALSCVASIAKCSTKLFYGYWNLFIPSSPSPLTPSIFSIILHDPSSKVRSVAINTLMSILDGSKTFLNAADDRSSNTKQLARGFTSFSATLAAMIREIHNGLFASLDSETHVPTINQTIKCIGVLVNNTPYDKLSSGLLTGILSRLWRLLGGYEEYNIRSTILTCMSTALNSKITSTEVSSLLTANGNNQNDSLFEYLLALFKSDRSLSNDILQVMCPIATNYFGIFSAYWGQLFPLLSKSFTDEEHLSRLNALKVVDEYTKVAAGAQEPDQLVTLWNQLLSSAFMILFKDSYHVIRATVCDCLGNITEAAFESLPDKLQSDCVAFVNSMASDSAPSVRAAACRTIGVYSLFPFLYRNRLFMVNASQYILNGLVDSSLTVRTKAAWSLGNFCDALINSPALVSELPEQFFVDIANAAIKGIADNDKVKSNAVRALGNFGRFSPPSVLSIQNGILVDKIVEGIVTCLNHGSVKVKWNACYAVGNLLRNPSIEKLFPNAQWVSSIFKSLISVLRDAKNFKIRINAALALSIPSLRYHYGSFIYQILYTLVESIETIEDKTDYAEFKYKETLEDQLIATLVHILTLTNQGDLNYIRQFVIEKRNYLIQQFKKYEIRSENTQFITALKDTIIKLNSL